MTAQTDIFLTSFTVRLLPVIYLITQKGDHICLNTY